MQKTAYEMRISDCSSDVCSSDLLGTDRVLDGVEGRQGPGNADVIFHAASIRARAGKALIQISIRRIQSGRASASSTARNAERPPSRSPGMPVTNQATPEIGRAHV